MIVSEPAVYRALQVRRWSLIAMLTGIRNTEKRVIISISRRNYTLLVWRLMLLIASICLFVGTWVGKLASCLDVDLETKMLSQKY